jgi:hypothetical protein
VIIVEHLDDPAQYERDRGHVEILVNPEWCNRFCGNHVSMSEWATFELNSNPEPIQSCLIFFVQQVEIL